MLMLQSGVYISLLQIFRKARISFLRVLHTVKWDLEEGRPCQASEILVTKKSIFSTVKSALNLLLRCTRRAHSPRLAHEAPVMQAILYVYSSNRIFRIQFITLSLPQDAYTVSPSCSAAGGLNASIQRVLSVLKGRRKKLLAPKKDGGN